MMVVEQSNIDHIMRGLQSTEGVRLHNHRKKLRQRFDIIKKLGQGTYGKVQLGINKETGQEVAIKTIKKCKIETEADLIRIRREIQIMSSVRHPNIIHIYEVFENREKMVLVMEYAAGGELYDFLNERKVLEETEARRIFRQISTAVYYCHKHKICHRDLKLENILLDEHGSAKIADFGLSNVYEDKRLLQTFCGSPLYASPEIVRGTPYRGPEVDCWSLGVLLYTLVYGAMPFDGSNFKRLVKQISNGEYYEPKKPKASPASPLIKEMLTVDPLKRATIEQICSHWWVNQSFNVSCLDIAEDLANQTPVRLDLLLSLAPPPDNSDNLVVTDEQASMSSQEPPPRSMSVGSLLDLNTGQEERRLELLEDKVVKRKLEAAPSETSMTKSSPKKKESRKGSEPPATVETTELLSTATASPGSIDHQVSLPEVAGAAALPPTAMDVDCGAAAAFPEEAAALPPTEQKLSTPPESAKSVAEPKTDSAISSDKPTRKSVKTVKKKATKDGVEVKKKKSESSPTDESKVVEEKEKIVQKESRASEPREEVGKEIKREGSVKKNRGNLKLNLKKEREKSEPPATPDEGPTKPMERRKSKIFETAEKFMSPEPKSPTVEKPKKVFIPGVKVSDFAKAFERKSSITTPTPVLKSSPSKKSVPKEDNKSDSKEEISQKEDKKGATPVIENKPSPPKEPTPINDEKISKMKDSARNVIANALVEEERKKIKKQILKPPVPRTKTEENVNTLDNKKKPLTLKIGSEKATVELHSPENTRFLFEPDKPTEPGKENGEGPKEKKTAKVNITLKSNTLPRRTSKAEIQLTSPNYRTEVEHRVGDAAAAAARGFRTQRSEVAFPVSAAQKPLRSASLEPESRRRERIIPIQVEDKVEKSDEARDRVAELDRQESITRGRPPAMPYQRTLSQRSSSLSRQSTQDSDTESTMSASGDPIKKSPREFIIPIAVEGGGYVTPRATSLEPSESMSKRRPFPRRISLFSDNGSEDESSSWRHDLDEPFRLHRLRSSRTARADSLSGSEDDEDDGFEILTAENLFSTLLSRVQSLTQRLNVEHGGRPGFPAPRLQSQRLLSGLHEPLTRLSERSLNRDMDGGRWPHGSDVSDSIRSVSRDRSRGRHSENYVESLSGHRQRAERRSQRSNSQSGPRDRPTSAYRTYSDTSGGPPTSYTRAKSMKERSAGDNSNATSPYSYSRSRSLREESSDHDKGAPSYSRQRSLKEEPTESLATPMKEDTGEERHRPTPSHTRSQSDSGPTSGSRNAVAVVEEPTEAAGTDFYNILAEKYGVVPMRRYDLEPRRRRSRSRDSREVPESKELETAPPDAVKAPSNSPSRIKKETTPTERYQTPSEKLAAVLNQLEGSYDKKGGKDVRGIPNDLLYPKKEKPMKSPTEFLKIENERLKDLSPKALELYEKTLGLYQKTLVDKKGKESDGKKYIPKLVPGDTSELLHDDYFKNKKLRHYGGFVKAIGDKEGTPAASSEGEQQCREDSPLSKKEKLIRRLSRELENEMSLKEDGIHRRKPTDVLKQDENLVKRLSKELEKEMEREKAIEKRNSPIDQHIVKKEADGQLEQAKPTARAKIFTSLEKKLDKLRPVTEKKYVDKAIRSLRESSTGPKEVVSENFLIKRAVSLGECSEPKISPLGPIQSTVNSVLGFFKKIDSNDSKAKQVGEAKPELLESTPPMLTPESSPTKDSKANYSPKKDKMKESPSRRLSLRSGNSPLMSLNDSSSFVSPDSESYDSWSNCSDFGTPDELMPVSKAVSPVMRNYDEGPSESVGERIRRKSFYTRFNERKKSRKNLDGHKKNDGEVKEEIPTYTRSITQNLDKARSPLPYIRSSTSADYSRKWYDDSRPRPFYKSEIASPTVDTPYRKTSLDWSKTLSPPTFVRSHSQSSSIAVPANNTSTLPRSYMGSYDSLRRPPVDNDRPFSPTRLRTPGRPFSPHSPSPSYD